MGDPESCRKRPVHGRLHVSRGRGRHRVGEPGLSDRGNTVQRQRGPRSRLPFRSWRGLAEPLTSVCLKFLTCKVGVVTMFLSGLWGTVTMGKAPGTWRAPGALVSPLPGPIGCCIPDGRKYSRRPLGALGGVNTPARGPRAHSRMFDVLSLPRTIPSLSMPLASSRSNARFWSHVLFVDRVARESGCGHNLRQPREARMGLRAHTAQPGI